MKNIQTKFICILTGIIIKKEISKKYDPSKTYYISPNHCSFIDILILYRVFRDSNIIFLGKKELLSIPLFNIYFKKLNIPIDRKKSISGKQAIIKIKKKINLNYSIVIFPEGTIRKNPTEIPARFKNGVFKMSLDDNVDILPVAIKNSNKILTPTPFFKGEAGPGIVKVKICDPINVNDYQTKEIEKLKSDTFEIIKNTLKQL